MSKAMSGLIERISNAFDDGELLGRFVEFRDESALAALIHRHGPMVWGVCRRLLSHHDAEDAFQATFIVLARKAASVKPREMVGNWLYGVARHAALQAKTTRRKEVQVAQIPDVEAPQDRLADVRPILDEELSRLPDHYRGVVVLCDLEGMTRGETARQLGIPEGSVASRLARARAMLAKRLMKRGVVFSSGSVLLSSAPPALVASTIKSITLLTAVKVAATGIISAKVSDLTEGVVKAMLLTKLKAISAALVVIVVLAGVFAQALASAQSREDTPTKENPRFLASAGKVTGQTDAATPVPDEKVKDELKALAGKWVCESSEVNGIKRGAKESKDQTITFVGEMCVLEDAVTGEVIESTYTLDLSGKFKVLTTKLKRKVGGKEIIIQYIYERDGDTLKICSNLLPGNELPKEFSAPEGSKRMSAVFKRTKVDRLPSQEKKEKVHPDLDAVFRVEIGKKSAISLRFDLPGKVDQSFDSSEYRYTVLDKDGVEVKDEALMINGASVHTVSLPKDQRSIVDESQLEFDVRQLKPGEEYYLVVSVRNLTGLAKFKVP